MSDIDLRRTRAARAGDAQADNSIELLFANPTHGLLRAETRFPQYILLHRA